MDLKQLAAPQEIVGQEMETAAFGAEILHSYAGIPSIFYLLSTISIHPYCKSSPSPVRWGGRWESSYDFITSDLFISGVHEVQHVSTSLTLLQLKMRFMKD